MASNWLADFSKIWINIQPFPFKIINFNISSANGHHFVPALTKLFTYRPHMLSSQWLQLYDQRGREEFSTKDRFDIHWAKGVPLVFKTRDKECGNCVQWQIRYYNLTYHKPQTTILTNICGNTIWREICTSLHVLILWKFNGIYRWYLRNSELNFEIHRGCTLINVWRPLINLYHPSTTCVR